MKCANALSHGSVRANSKWSRQLFYLSIDNYTNGTFNYLIILKSLITQFDTDSLFWNSDGFGRDRPQLWPNLSSQNYSKIILWPSEVSTIRLDFWFLCEYARNSQTDQNLLSLSSEKLLLVTFSHLRKYLPGDSRFGV